ncbi:MAG: penicillin-binding protein [Treponema sp.]|jgi:cell division protein FtsI (penicillin-binding protein 3)|nr:penicillin-binding protein [Treponema sp.]
MRKRRYITLFSLLVLFSFYLIVHYAILMNKSELPSVTRLAAGIPERGPILDRNERILAISIRFADVSVWRPSLSNIDIVSDELEVYLDMPSAQIREKIISSESNFIYLKKQIDDVTARRLTAMLNEKKLKGVMVQPIVGRVYPEKNLASQIIGFVGDGNRGLEGIEYAFNNVLDGTDDDGKGSQVILTIDSNVQHILEEIALRAMEENDAEAVMLIAMDPRSGDILGSASLPDFDPNNFRVSDDNSRMNRPVIWAYEPGSVFKIFTIAAFLDYGAVSGSTVFNCTGIYEMNRSSPINCLGVHGRVSAREIIIHSCNVGAAYSSERISNANFYNLLNNFGFGSRTGAGCPGEHAGYLVQSANWSDRSKPTLAFGQEISVTAWQMMQAATAIANDGILVPPRIVLKTVSADGKTVTDWHAGESRRILKAETARAMRSYMVDTATGYGMGWRAAVQDMSLAVKTGTAQTIDPVTRRYSETDFIASCIALLPAESPSLILYLAILKPKGIIFGARIAAPAIREAAESLIDYLGIPRGRNEYVNHPPSVNIPAGRLPEIDTVVPDYTGIAKRVLLPLLLRDDLDAEIRGDGWVRSQDPPAGTPFTKGMTIVFDLE